MNLVGISSIDMIRVKSRVNKACAERYLRPLAFHPAVDYWRSNNVFGYIHNFKIPFGDSSIYLGIERIEDRKGSNKFSYVMEFNPNKTIFCDRIADFDLWQYFEQADIYRYDFESIKFVRWLFFDIIMNIEDVEFKSIQYCYDIETSISKILSIRGMYNRKIFEMRKGKTIYIGENFMKIYDKSAEAGIKDKDITRFEVTLKLDCKLKDVAFEDVNTCSYVIKEDLKGVEGALVYAVANGYDINDLDWRWKEKIKKYLEDNSEEIVIRGCDIQKDFFEFVELLKSYSNVLLRICKI